MKNVIKSIAIFIFFLSCNGNENFPIVHEDYYVKVEAFYKFNNSDELYPDGSSDVFVYYGIQSLDIVGFNIDEKGKLIKDNKEILPNKYIKTSAEGKCMFMSDNLDEHVTIIIVSHQFKELLAINSFYNSRTQIEIKSVVTN